MNAQTRLGAFILLALILLVFATGKISDISWFRQDTNLVEAEFDDLMGLDIQSPVRMAGVKIGVVQDIFLRHNRAVVSIALNRDVQLPASVRASIISRGLVGEKNIALTATPADTQLLAAGAIIPSDPSGDINTFITKATGITDNIRTMTNNLSAESGDDAHTSLQQLLANANSTAKELSAMIKENRTQLTRSTASMQQAMQAMESDLPLILNNLKQASKTLNQLIGKHRDDLDHFAAELPKTTRAGTAFFEQGRLATTNLNSVVVDNSENLYRTLFELRKASENLAAFSDDIRRNPWKLMTEKPEIKPDRRARQRQMEEMLMTTGSMGLEPTRK
ncbi:MAG: MlaD family protein [Mariprofundus sp.]